MEFWSPRERPPSIASPRGRLRGLILATSSRYDHFFEFSRWSLTRASTVATTLLLLCLFIMLYTVTVGKMPKEENVFKTAEISQSTSYFSVFVNKFSLGRAVTLTNIVLPAVGKFTVLTISIQPTSVNLRWRAVPQPNESSESRKKRHVTGWSVNISQDCSLVIMLPRPNINHTNLVCIIGRDTVKALDSSLNDLSNR